MRSIWIRAHRAQEPDRIERDRFGRSITLWKQAAAFVNHPQRGSFFPTVLTPLVPAKAGIICRYRNLL
jgi:hypothetical protein